MAAATLLSLCLLGSAPPAPKALGPQTITVRVDHHFSTAEAHSRVQQLLDYWKSRFGVAEAWSGDRVWVWGNIIGVDFNAILEVTDGLVKCESNDPGGLWRSFAQDYVSKKLRKYLSPKYEEP